MLILFSTIKEKNWFLDIKILKMFIKKGCVATDIFLFEYITEVSVHRNETFLYRNGVDCQNNRMYH